MILQQLVQVIRKMGPHSRFSVEVSDGSELTMQLLQRRFQRFSDDWLRRIMNALRNWQIWASKHCPPLPFWNPSANQLGEYLISVDKRGPTVARSVWTQLDWVRRELGGAFPTDSLLLASFRLHAVGHLPTPAAEMPPGVFPCDHKPFKHYPGRSRNFRWDCNASGYSLFALATPSPINFALSTF